MEAEIGVMWPGAKECWLLLGAGTGQEVYSSLEVPKEAPESPAATSILAP
jgi:hypothetical protein